jgi:hypothetical protein
LAGLAAIAAIALVALAWRLTHRPATREAMGQEPTWPPLGRRVTVEVLNGGGTPGAARDAALRLRRGGLDVVSWDNAPVSLRDTTTTITRVLLRTGDSIGSGRVAEVLGATDVRDAPDSTRLVDLTVIVPRDSAP